MKLGTCSRARVVAGLLRVAAGVLPACQSGAPGGSGPPSASAEGPSSPGGASSPAPALTPFSVDLATLPPRESLPPGTLRILVLGDSSASFLGLALRYRQDEARAFVAARGVGECSLFAVGSRPLPELPPIQTSCSSSWVADVTTLQPDVTLLVLGGAFFGEATCDAAWLRAYGDRLRELAAAMGPASGRLVLAEVPYPVGDWRHGRVLGQVDCLNGLFRELTQTGPFARVDLQHHVCPTPECVRESQGAPLRPDGLHFDGVGAEETARWLLGELGRLGRAGSGG